MGLCPVGHAQGIAASAQEACRVREVWWQRSAAEYGARPVWESPPTPRFPSPVAGYAAMKTPRGGSSQTNTLWLDLADECEAPEPAPAGVTPHTLEHPAREEAVHETPTHHRHGVPVVLEQKTTIRCKYLSLHELAIVSVPKKTRRPPVYWTSTPLTRLIDMAHPFSGCKRLCIHVYSNLSAS